MVYSLNKAVSIFALSAVLLASAGIQCVKEARAEGMTAHELISYMVQQKTSGELRSLLDSQQDAYRNGSIFPDVAQSYLSSKVKWADTKTTYSSDDLSHGQQNGKPEGMLNEYLKLMKDQCGSVYRSDETVKCKQARAFFLGIISHVVADGPWHTDFIGLAKTNAGVVSLRDRCGDDAKKAHNFADTDMDICLAKQLNNGVEDVALDPDKKQANLSRKNTRIAQGCPDGQWWHIGGGDGLLGACWKCPSGYSHDLGKLPNENGVCYKNRAISCSKIKVDDLGIDVGNLRRISITASALGFSIAEHGYGYAAGAYNRLNSAPGYQGIGDRTDTNGLMDMAKSDQFLPNLTFAHSAGKDKFLDTGYADKCDWGFSNVVSGAGGIKMSAFAVRLFIDKVWTHLQFNEDFAVLRFGAYNYAITRNGVVEHCSIPDSSKGCPP